MLGEKDQFHSLLHKFPDYFDNEREGREGIQKEALRPRGEQGVHLLHSGSREPGKKAWYLVIGVRGKEVHRWKPELGC